MQQSPSQPTTKNKNTTMVCPEKLDKLGLPVKLHSGSYRRCADVKKVDGVVSPETELECHIV